MNDVELLGQALLQVGKVKFLYSGVAKKFGETIELNDDVSNYEMLLVNFSFSGMRQTIVMKKNELSITTYLNYISPLKTSDTITHARVELKKIDNRQYMISSVKSIKETEILLDDNVTGVTLQSIVGIS